MERELGCKVDVEKLKNTLKNIFVDKL
jgi:hypothetical protein